MESPVSAGAESVHDVTAYQELGPFYEAASLGRLRGTQSQSLDEQVRRGEIICLTTSDGKRVYPGFQFDGPNLAPLPDLDLVLDALDPHRRDPWGDATWLRETRPELDGRSPLQALRDGDADPVTALARQAGTLLGP